MNVLKIIILAAAAFFAFLFYSIANDTKSDVRQEILGIEFNCPNQATCQCVEDNLENISWTKYLPWNDYQPIFDGIADYIIVPCRKRYYHNQ